MTTTTQHVILNNGKQMPTLGIGTWRLDAREEVAHALVNAIDKCGYRHIDTASQYKNEHYIGDVLKTELNHVQREELFITTKLWPTNHSPHHVRQACERSLKLLQLEYLDLYLMYVVVCHCIIHCIHLISLINKSLAYCNETYKSGVGTII
jgi:diketogulonate reductase-like aldo/keto reductase